MATAMPAAKGTLGPGDQAIVPDEGKLSYCSIGNLKYSHDLFSASAYLANPCDSCQIFKQF